MLNVVNVATPATAATVLVPRRFAPVVPVPVVIATVAGAYEIIEWQYALNSDPAAGIAVLGSQGDIWDAQKDILADTLGAFLVIGLFFLQYRNELKTLGLTRAQ